MTRSIAIALLAFALALPAGAQLPEPVMRGLALAGIPASAMGVVVQRLPGGAPVLMHNAQQSMQPASTLKLLTSWVALEALGPAWRGRSELRHDGTIANGVLHGNLYLRGMGDVDLDWRALEQMLRVGRLRGVREIRGDLVLDRSWFSPPRTDLGVAPFDESPEFRYNVIPDALLLNANLVQLDLAADGARLQVAMTPPLDGVTVRSEMTLVERTCVDWEDGWRHPTLAEHVRGPIEIRLQGEFPRDCVASTAINAIDRTVFAERLVRSLWRGMGGALHGTAREGTAPVDTVLLANHLSRPLTDLVRDINKVSDNPVTRVMYLVLGASSGDPGSSTAQRSEARVRAQLAARGISGEGLVLENGSGLSRSERIRPLALAGVLREARVGPWAAEFLSSLPIVAVDGAMRTRLNGSPAAARARIKTGTLRDASAVAGYVTDVAGEEYVVVAIINDPRAVGAVSRPILDTLLDWVARGRAGSPP